MPSYADDQMTAGRGQDLLVAGLTVGLIEELIEGLIAGLIAGMIVGKTAGEGLLTSDEREDLLIGEKKWALKT